MELTIIANSEKNVDRVTQAYSSNLEMRKGMSLNHFFTNFSHSEGSFSKEANGVSSWRPFWRCFMSDTFVSVSLPGFKLEGGRQDAMF